MTRITALLLRENWKLMFTPGTGVSLCMGSRGLWTLGFYFQYHHRPSDWLVGNQISSTHQLSCGAKSNFSSCLKRLWCETTPKEWQSTEELRLMLTVNTLITVHEEGLGKLQTQAWISDRCQSRKELASCLFSTVSLSPGVHFTAAPTTLSSQLCMKINIRGGGVWKWTRLQRLSTSCFICNSIPVNWQCLRQKILRSNHVACLLKKIFKINSCALFAYLFLPLCAKGAQEWIFQ